MHRRRLLGAVGAAGASLTAGCAGLGLRVGSADPPAFEASLSVPAELTLGAAFSATVTVTNTGGLRGSYRGRIRAFAGMIHETDRAVEVGPIEPGASLSGWVALLVPAPADGVVAVVWNRDLSSSPPEAFWRS